MLLETRVVFSVGWLLLVMGANLSECSSSCPVTLEAFQRGWWKQAQPPTLCQAGLSFSRVVLFRASSYFLKGLCWSVFSRVFEGKSQQTSQAILLCSSCLSSILSCQLLILWAPGLSALPRRLVKPAKLCPGSHFPHCTPEILSRK